MNSRVIWLLCFLVAVEVWSAECRRNGTRSQSKPSSRVGKNRIIGGNPTAIPNWIGSAWSQPGSKFQPRADGKFHGLCINIGPRLVLAQIDAVTFLEERSKPTADPTDTNQRSDYISPTPEKIHNINGVPSHGQKNSEYLIAYKSAWRFTIYRRYDRKNANTPLFKPPFPIYETNKTNLGSNCIMSGYSQTVDQVDQKHERVFASVPVEIAENNQKNCTEEPIYKFYTFGGNVAVCDGFRDVGNPIMCGDRQSERKLTYIVVDAQRESGSECGTQFLAYHVAHLVDSIQFAIRKDKLRGLYDKQSFEERW